MRHSEHAVDITLKRDIVGRILDLGGGGEGVIGRTYGRAVTAIDICPDELEDAPGDFERICMDARRLEFPDGCFDSVPAFCFLMYLLPEDMGAVFAEAARVLKSGGRMYVWDAVYDCAFPEPHLAELNIDAAGEKISTTYGVLGEGMGLSLDDVLSHAAEAGLELAGERLAGEHFYLVFKKEERHGRYHDSAAEEL